MNSKRTAEGAGHTRCSKRGADVLCSTRLTFRPELAQPRIRGRSSCEWSAAWPTATKLDATRLAARWRDLPSVWLSPRAHLLFETPPVHNGGFHTDFAQPATDDLLASKLSHQAKSNCKSVLSCVLQGFERKMRYPSAGAHTHAVPRPTRLQNRLPLV